MTNQKKSFVLYSDQFELFNALTDEQAGKLIKHIYNYVNGVEGELNDQLLKVAFIGIKSALIRDLEKWDKQLKQRSEAGKKSAAKRYGSNEKERPLTTVNENKRASTDNVNVNVNDNVNVNESVTIEPTFEITKEIINFVDDDHFNEYFKIESSLINNDAKKKKKLREKKESLETFKRIDIGNANYDLVQLYIKYLFVRCDKGNAILNPDAMQANFNKLNKLNENQKMECLLMSVENNWIGLFPDKIQEKKPQKIGSMNVSNMPKYDFENIPDPLKDFR
jgi:hypothetical protein